MRAGAGWWGWEEDILLAPESEFQLQAAYSPSLPPRQPALVPSTSRLRPGATPDSAGLGPHPTEFSTRVGVGAWTRPPLFLPGAEGMAKE